MSFRVSGKNIDVGETLRERIDGRLAEACNKYFDGGGYSGHATIGKEAFGFRTEFVVHLDSGIVLHADAMAADAYASADLAAERIEKRLRRYTRRLKDHHAAARADGKTALDASQMSAPSYVIAALEDEAESEGFSPVIIAESTTALRRMAVSEAVLELDMTGAPVLIFHHAGHGRINIVYRRGDGNIGWIDPPELGAGSH